MKDIVCLWYIAPIEHLESILQHGILCRNLALRSGYVTKDISCLSVQSKRSEFHGDVPLFFADNTPMLYDVFNDESEEISLLGIDNCVIDFDGVWFSNGNLGSGETSLYNSLEDITSEEWDIIFSRSGAYSKRWKRIRAAEVSVPRCVSPEYIKSISVASNISARCVRKILRRLKLKIPVRADLTAEGIS